MGAALSYEDYQPLFGPPWWQRGNSGKFQGALGRVKDDLLERNRQALLAGTPGQCPADALPHVGDDRMLPQASGETDDDYAERLRTAWDAPDGWAFAGSHGGMLRALVRAGFPSGVTGTYVVQKVRRYSYLDTSGPDPVTVFGTHAGFTFDGSPASYWNRFAVVFASDVADLTTGSDLALKLNALVRLWKPAKAFYVGAYVMVSGIAWGWPPSLEWGAGGHVWGEGGSVVRFVAPR